MHWYSVIPPLLAIAIVLWKKEVILALIVAVFSAELIIAITQDTTVLLSPIIMIERVVEVGGTPGNARILMFSLLIGVLLA